MNAEEVRLRRQESVVNGRQAVQMRVPGPALKGQVKIKANQKPLGGGGVFGKRTGRQMLLNKTAVGSKGAEARVSAPFWQDVLPRIHVNSLFGGGGSVPVPLAGGGGRYGRR